MKRLGLIFLCISLLTVSQAQKKKLNIWALPEVGLVAGALNPAADLRLTGGVSQGNWRYGVGMAFDEYRQESYPVFLQARRQFHWRKWHPFVFGSAGYNIRSGSDTILTWFSNRVENYRGGVFAEGGLGLSFNIKKKERFSLSFYQSYKRSSTTFQEFRWLGPGNTITVPTTDIFRMNRFGVRIGWKFGK